MTSDPEPLLDRIAVLRSRMLAKASGAALSGEEDFVAVEESLEIRVRGYAYAVLMRTPGRERDLIAGFLAAEGLLQGAQDLISVEPCMAPNTREPEPHIWNVSCAEGVAFDPRDLRRTVVSSSCGLCGAQSLEQLQREMPARQVELPDSLSTSSLLQAFDRLRAGQDLFA
ncbi:MAG: formate dehydrogenase accessory sulfurtransferase FdhD, partial [Planctomycetota bacterium]